IIWMMSSSVMTPLLWIGAVLSLSWFRAEPIQTAAAQPGLERRQGAFAATRFYRRADPTSTLFLVRRGADGAVDHHRADGPLPEIDQAQGWPSWWGMAIEHFASLPGQQ